MTVLDRLQRDGDETDALFRPYLTESAAQNTEERQADLSLLREHINSICCKIDSNLLTAAQREVFRHAEAVARDAQGIGRRPVGPVRGSGSLRGV